MIYNLKEITVGRTNPILYLKKSQIRFYCSCGVPSPSEDSARASQLLWRSSSCSHEDRETLGNGRYFNIKAVLI